MGGEKLVRFVLIWGCQCSPGSIQRPVKCSAAGERDSEFEVAYLSRCPDSWCLAVTRVEITIAMSLQIGFYPKSNFMISERRLNAPPLRSSYTSRSRVTTTFTFTYMHLALSHQCAQLVNVFVDTLHRAYRVRAVRVARDLRRVTSPATCHHLISNSK